MQNKLIEVLNKCLKQKTNHHKSKKIYITLNFRVSPYFDYKQISSTNFASVHICKAKCNRKQNGAVSRAMHCFYYTPWLQKKVRAAE